MNCSTTENGLYKRYEFDDFKTAFEFMERVANIAENRHHHPVWKNSYNIVDIWLISHDNGSTITEKDTLIAQVIDHVV